MSLVWPSPCCRLRILSYTVNISHGWNHRNHHTLHCWLSFFSVLSLVMSLACCTADLLFCVHCRAPQWYWKCVCTKKKKIGCPFRAPICHFSPLLHSFNTRVAVSHPLTQATYHLRITYAALHLCVRPIWVPIWVLCIFKYFWHTENIFADEPYRNSMSCDNAGETKKGLKWFSF